MAFVDFDQYSRGSDAILIIFVWHSTSFIYYKGFLLSLYLYLNKNFKQVAFVDFDQYSRGNKNGCLYFILNVMCLYISENPFVFCKKYFLFINFSQVYQTFQI